MVFFKELVTEKGFLDNNSGSNGYQTYFTRILNVVKHIRTSLNSKECICFK